MAGIEYILGIKIFNNIMHFEPCIPKHWKEVNKVYKYGKSIYNIRINNYNGKNKDGRKVIVNGVKSENNIILENNGKIFNIEIEM